MAAEREIIEEAYAGDIIGVFDPGIFSIGDTCAPRGRSSSSPASPPSPRSTSAGVRSVDTMKRKQFIKGWSRSPRRAPFRSSSCPAPAWRRSSWAWWAPLQFDVFEYRMRSEYGVELYMEGLPYEYLRVITACPCKPEDLVLSTGAALLEDFKGRLLVAFGGEWSVGFLTKHNPGLELAESLSV